MAVTLYYLEGYSIRETADILETTENIVKKRLMRARQQLRDDLDRNVRARTWSEYAAIRFESEASSEMDESLRVMVEELNIHAVGEAFPAWYEDDMWNPMLDDLMAKVVSVEVTDNISALDPTYFPAGWEESMDENGNLKTNVLEYYTRGDGVNTLTQLSLTEEVDQKCVKATVEYTNTALRWIWYCWMQGLCSLSKQRMVMPFMIESRARAMTMWRPPARISMMDWNITM